MWQYYSKWARQWRYFTDGFGNKYNPGEEEIKQHRLFKYQLRKTKK